MDQPCRSVFVLTVSCLWWWAAGANTFGTPETIELNGQWLLTNENKSIVVNGNVPGSMYTDLMRNGTIGNPYYSYNDVAYRWVALDNWTYSRTFDIFSDLLKRNKILLVCDGLDTVSSIFINGKLVGKTDNMFVRYVFDIKGYLKAGQNNITVQFLSAPLYAQAVSQLHSYPVPPTCPPEVQHGECMVNFIRKEQCSFSWDWGPSFPTQGIWRSISIEVFDVAVLRDVTVETIPGDDLSSWTVRVGAFFNTTSGSVHGQLQITIRNLQITTSTTVTLSNDESIIDVEVDKHHSVDLWWPNGHGNQTLYTLDVVFISDSGENTKRTLNFGFRKIELVQEKITNSSGLSFYFKVNNKAIFMKGSNWIPADSFQERVTESRLRNLLQSAVDANMNMLRVWGGGIYEQDAFYELTDQLGILIWQDFMFACALYPVDDYFIDSVRQEVTYQVRRLKHHPSIAVWAGNNENEAALATNWYDIVKKNYPRYKSDYITLYVNNIRSIVLTEDSSRPFVSSSPTNGLKTVSEGWLSLNPYDTHYGDVHTYNYYDDSWDWRTIPRPRFASEYGFQSWPSMSSLKGVVEESELDYFGKFASHRQHHENGNLQMLSEAMRHLKIPDLSSNPVNFHKIVFITQINQAVSIKTQTEFYLRSQSEIINGEGRTMGALYWQLNDIWQAPTWSSLEYSGKWKLLHYFARKFFAPTLLSPYIDNEVLKVYLVSNDIEPFTHKQDHKNDIESNLHYYARSEDAEHHNHLGDLMKENVVNPKMRLFEKLKDIDVTSEVTPGAVYVSCYQWDSFEKLYTWPQKIDQVTKAAESVFEGNITQMLELAGCPLPKKCFFTFDTDLPTTSVIPSAYLPLDSYEAAKLEPANVTIASVMRVGSDFIIQLTCQRIAAFVTLDCGQISGRFSDNGFLMLVGELTISFYPWQAITLDELKAELIVTSLNDIYT